MGARTYDFYLHGENGRRDLDARISLPSVTTIISATLAKPQLVRWAYNCTVDTVAQAVQMLRDGALELDDFLDTFSDHDMLDEWIRASGVHYDDVLEVASRRGQDAHKLLETLTALHAVDPSAALKHADKMVDVAKDPYKQAVARWWVDRRPRPVFAEKVVYSLAHRYAGRLDMLADLNVEEGDSFALSDEPHQFHRTVVDLKTRRAGLGVYDSDQVQLGGYKVALEEMGLDDGYSLDRLVLLAHDDGAYEEGEVWIDDSAFLDLVAVYWKKRKKRTT